MRFGPCQCLLFRLEEFVDYDRVAFLNGPARLSCGLAIFNRGSGIDRGEAAAIRKSDLASVGNVVWIDRAMSGVQSRSGGGFVFARVTIGTFAAAGPINRYAGEQR